MNIGPLRATLAVFDDAALEALTNKGILRRAAKDVDGGKVTIIEETEARIAAVRRLAEARVTLLGLAALDERAVPDFDRGMAGRLADVGMKVAALTPERFADWLAEVIR